MPALKLVSHRCKTNTQSATAFRGFGGPQGMFGIETVMDEIAMTLGKDPLEVRKLNLYKDPAISGTPDTMTTQYNQLIEDWVGDKVIDQVEQESKYAERRASGASLQRQEQNPQARFGALVPLKFGISFTATHLNQGGALLVVYMDGSVSCNHGGTEMGQGLNTKMAQVCADGLGISVDHVRITATDSQKVPNASATSASSGADINGAAIMNATMQMRERLKPVAARMLGCAEGDVTLPTTKCMAAANRSSGPTLTKQAYMDRVGLSVTGFYMTPEIKYDFATLNGRAFLLLLLRRGRERSGNRHPHRRVVAQGCGHRARRGPQHQPRH